MRACRLLACAALLVAGCGERHPQSGAATPPVASSGPVAGSRVGVARVYTLSPPESTIAPNRTEPTAEYPSLAAARDAIEAILRRAANPADTAIHFGREAVTFRYRFASASAAGWAVRVVVNDTSACPHEKLIEALPAAGWVDDYGYSADGADGTNMGFVCRQFLCLIEAHWDGGDPTDSTYVPLPGCEVLVTCVPRRADDVRPE